MYKYKLANLNNLPDNITIAAFDVTSLYTNIDIDEGIKACKEILATHRPITDIPNNSVLIDILRLVLENNNFDFAGRHFLQRKGVAMGSSVSPSVANIFMAQFERKFVFNHPHQPVVWLRYIDDIFAIFSDT